MTRSTQPSDAGAAFIAARDFLLAHRTDDERAVAEFRWPQLDRFNWALDYFDAIAAGTERTALDIVEEDGSRTIRSFAELSADSNRVANFLKRLGARRGDRLLLMLGNELPLWETFLAAMKLGVVVTPATTLLTPADLRERVERGRVAHVVAGHANATKFDDVPGRYTRIAVGGDVRGWHSYDESRAAEHGVRAGDVNGGDRSHAALLHVRDDVETEAGDAHASELSGRSPVDDVLDRAAAWRSSLEHQLAGVGETRVELLLRAVERGGDDLHL